MATYNTEHRIKKQLDNGQWIGFELNVDGHFDYMGNERGYTIKKVAMFTFETEPRADYPMVLQKPTNKVVVPQFGAREFWFKQDKFTWMMNQTPIATAFNQITK